VALDEDAKGIIVVAPSRPLDQLGVRRFHSIVLDSFPRKRLAAIAGGGRGLREIARRRRLKRTGSAAYDSAVTTNVQKLFEQALTLAAADRAELAAQLLATLDSAEADVESAWAAEIERRAAEARLNPDDDEDWRTVLDEIQREVLTR
jgi:hypothetical protein